VTIAPNRIISDLDALSQRLGLPMMLGRELLASVGGTGLLGDSAHFKTLWENLDPTSPIAVVWILPPKARGMGFCTALTFRDAEKANRSFEGMGTLGVQQNGVSERRIPSGEKLWGGVKGRTLFISGSAKDLSFGCGLAEVAQVAPTDGQMVLTILPQSLAKASGKSPEELVAHLTSTVAAGMQVGKKKNKQAAEHMASAMVESMARLVLDSTAVRLLLELGPKDGLLIRAELVPAAGTNFAALTAHRKPYTFDDRLPVRDDRTGVMAFGNASVWLSTLSKMFEASGPAGRAVWRDMNKTFELTSEWSCSFELADIGIASLCSSPIRPGTSPKTMLDTIVAMTTSQQAWEAEIEGRKGTPIKIKRSRDLIEIEKKIENTDATAKAMAKAIAGGDTAKIAMTVKAGRLLQASGKDARKMLTLYGSGSSMKEAPLVAAALGRTKGDEGVASIDVISFVLRVLGQNKGMPGHQLAVLAAALPGLTEMKAPVLFALRSGQSLTGDFRLPLGSLENIAKVVNAMMGQAGALPSR
jgi:hypothetical protein